MNKSNSFKLILIISIFSNPLYLKADDDCDLLCQLGQEPVFEDQNNNQKNDYTSPSNNNRDRSFSNSDFLNEADVIRSIQSFAESSGFNLGEYVDYKYDLFKISSNKITVANFRVYWRDNLSDPFIKVASIGKFECYGRNISNKTYYLNSLINIAAPIEYYRGLMDNSYCEIGQIKADFVDDPILLYEFIEEMDLGADRNAIALVTELLSDISFKTYIKSSGRNNHEIGTQIFVTRDNAIEFKMQLSGLIDIYTKLFKSYDGFYEWLGFSSVNEYKDYFNSLDEGEYFMESIEMQEYFAEYLEEKFTYDEGFLFDFLFSFDIKKIESNIMWSQRLYSSTNQMSEGQLDMAMSFLKQYTLSQMSKYDITSLFIGALGPDATRSVVDLAYPIYERAFRELQIFVSNPKGIGFSISNNSNVNFYDIIMSTNEPTPIEFIGLISGLDIQLKANPTIRK